MPPVRLVAFKGAEGCLIAAWFDTLPEPAYVKGMARIRRLAELGYEIRRPEADYLEEGIYELRWRFQSVNYLVLYFFHGRETVVLSHGLTKEDRVPPREIDLALRNKAQFLRNPAAHTHRGELS